MTSDADISAWAERILHASDSRTSIPPVTSTDPSFDLARAYRVSAAITDRRTARGERPVGWKIGFTNRAIWEEYGVFAPIWGPMYTSTVQAYDAGEASCALDRFLEPRLEPEIAFRFASTPESEMSEEALLGHIDAVTHGFEIVHSVFPGWRFRAPDTVAAFALHGAYHHGPWVRVDASDHPKWMASLGAFELTLLRNGEPVERGHARNVLDGPLSALRHFVRGLGDQPGGQRLSPGDIVTTGTVTRAFPVRAGETWSTDVKGLGGPEGTVAGLTLALT